MAGNIGALVILDNLSIPIAIAIAVAVVLCRRQNPDTAAQAARGDQSQLGTAGLPADNLRHHRFLSGRHRIQADGLLLDPQLVAARRQRAEAKAPLVISRRSRAVHIHHRSGHAGTAGPVGAIYLALESADRLPAPQGNTDGNDQHGQKRGLRLVESTAAAAPDRGLETRATA